jgi:hypothetical protein
MAQLAASDLNWDVPIEYRRGSPARLAGIDLYYDFRWFDHFNDARAQFKHGLCLARLVKRSCPTGLTPALLLTAGDTVEERIIQTDSHFVLVVDLPRYRSQATGNAAESYYADRLGIQTLATRPDVVNAVLTQLSIDDISTWVSEDVDRIDQVRGIAGVHGEFSTPATAAEAIASLRALDNLDASDMAALASLFARDTDRDARTELVRRITGGPNRTLRNWPSPRAAHHRSNR